MTGELHALGAAELSRLYAAGAASPVEVLRAVLARIARWEPTIAATWALDADAAMAMARDAERRWREGRALSPLDGLPVTIKENVATRGVPVPLGTAATPLVPAADDAPPAARLREAGAVIVCKTTMPDYGMLSSGLSSFHAQSGKLSRNPWDPRLGPGGSSAGAGAAAAAGYGPLHVGTDIGGSIRLPAGWCGVVGFKPSNGRIPIKPPYLGRVAGPMTRSVEDAALMMAVLSRPDWRDATSLPPQEIAWHDTAGLALAGLRIGVWMDAGWGLPLDPAIEAAVYAAARAFEAAGAVLVPVAPFTTPEMAQGIQRFWQLRSWLDISALPPAQADRVLPYIRAWAEGGAGCTPAQVFHGWSQFAALRDAAVAACHGVDFVISPVAPCMPFPAEHASPTNDPRRALEHIGYTLPFNASEQPAISVPCGHSVHGLPIGLQIAGQRHDDLGVLRLARAFEALRPPLRPWPEPPLPAPAA
jgi:Asp-tRNA(Asn)/Glu-tRNA(Gln) amidotransferase A subunit family amidase